MAFRLPFLLSSIGDGHIKLFTQAFVVGAEDQPLADMLFNPLNALRAAIFLVAWTVYSAGSTLAAEALDGFWRDSDGEVILEIKACGAARCGRVAWLKKPLGPDGKLLRDYRNPDPELRDRLVCGLEVVSGFKKQSDGTWGDGTVYVSDEGMSFSGFAEMLSSTQVKVTGYVGISIFGSSEVWTKTSRPQGSCPGNAKRG